jgi:Ribbon-helix-helix protein, copG family
MARPTIYDQQRVATQVRLPKDQLDSLKALADARDVSVNFLIMRAVDAYLKAASKSEGSVLNPPFPPPAPNALPRSEAEGSSHIE